MALPLAAPRRAPARRRPPPPPQAGAVRPDEPHLRNLRQLTFGGENAEAYWSPDGKQLIFQRDRGEGVPCDQQFVLDLATGARRRVSNGKGRITCGYFPTAAGACSTPRRTSASPRVPAAPRLLAGLRLADVRRLRHLHARARRQRPSSRLTDTPGYDAEATVSPDGKKIVFTSVRDGDLEIYTMDADGTNVRRLTHEPGYDGGPFFSPDGKRIVYRRDAPTDEASLAALPRAAGAGPLPPRASSRSG